VIGRRVALRGGVLSAAVMACAVSSGPAALAQGWIVTVGGDAQAAVPYEGAGYNIFVPIPSIEARRPDRPDRPPFADDDPGFSVISTGWLSVGPSVSLRGERDDEGERAGLRDVPLAVEPGLFIVLWPADWLRLRATERRGVRGDHGWTGDASLDLVADRGRWTATIGPRTGWGDQNYMETYFGVTPGEAAASPTIHTPYAPSGGLRYVGVYGQVGYRFNASWEAWANTSFHRLASGPADSPIVRQIGSRDDISGGLTVMYSFNWGR
jgi:outer membrane protein